MTFSYTILQQKEINMLNLHWKMYYWSCFPFDFNDVEQLQYGCKREIWFYKTKQWTICVCITYFWHLQLSTELSCKTRYSSIFTNWWHESAKKYSHIYFTVGSGAWVLQPGNSIDFQTNTKYVFMLGTLQISVGPFSCSCSYCIKFSNI